MKGKWTYIESEALNHTVAFDENTGWLFCEDGTKYSPQELAKLTQNWQKAQELPLQVHIVKKAFGGTIVTAGKQ